MDHSQRVSAVEMAPDREGKGSNGPGRSVPSEILISWTTADQQRESVVKEPRASPNTPHPPVKDSIIRVLARGP